jgi:hypothetical protein
VRESPGGIMAWHRGGLLPKLLSMQSLWLGGKANTHSQLAGYNL